MLGNSAPGPQPPLGRRPGRRASSAPPSARSPLRPHLRVSSQRQPCVTAHAWPRRPVSCGRCRRRRGNWVRMTLWEGSKGQVPGDWLPPRLVLSSGPASGPPPWLTLRVIASAGCQVTGSVDGGKAVGRTCVEDGCVGSRDQSRTCVLPRKMQEGLRLRPAGHCLRGKRGNEPAVIPQDTVNQPGTARPHGCGRFLQPPARSG